MNRKRKGITYERELIHLFWNTKEWAATRVAGSGNSQFPSADIIAGNKTRKLAIECKSAKRETIYIPIAEIKEFKIFTTTFGAEPWLAARFQKTPWFFLSLEDVEKTEKNIIITKKNCKLKGLLFEELIKTY